MWYVFCILSALSVGYKIGQYFTKKKDEREIYLKGYREGKAEGESIAFDKGNSAGYRSCLNNLETFVEREKLRESNL